MNTSANLNFLLTILENMRIPAALLQAPFENAETFDLGIRKIAYPQIDYAKYTHRFYESCKPQIIYKAYDEFLFSYLILLLPDTDSSPLFVIGPYTTEAFQEHEILNKAQEFNIPPELFFKFKNCYEQIPILADGNVLFTLINSFAAMLWGSMDSFTMAELSSFSAHQTDEAALPLTQENTDELLLSMQNTEAKYAAENEFLQMVSHGQIHKIEMYLDLINLTTSEQRYVDKLRNAKNYALTMNTLLRKTAEQSAVPPIHIDKVSTSFAKKIELQTSESGITLLLKEMARKYTFLIKNHSMKGYSTLVRRVLTYIDNDLSADLSLSTLASITKTNPSYLSTVFKKETGHTLTEYVTGKRMEYAVLLLNATNMQVQTIALYCGIPDVCYFSKTFKKTYGKTPTEYRK